VTAVLNIPRGVRLIRPDELLLPGQAVIIIMEGAPSTTTRVANGLADDFSLALQKSRALGPTRVGVLYRAVVALAAPQLVARIAELRGSSPLQFATLTNNLGEIAEDALDETLDVAVEVVTFVPRAAGRAAANFFKDHGGAVLFGFVVVVGGAAAFLALRKD